MKSNEKIETEVINKVVDLSLCYCIESSKVILKFLDNRLKYLQRIKQLALDNKPIFPFKKSMKKWNDELIEIENQIFDIYQQIGYEVEIMNDTMKMIDR